MKALTNGEEQALSPCSEYKTQTVPKAAAAHMSSLGSKVLNYGSPFQQGTLKKTSIAPKVLN